MIEGDGFSVRTVPATTGHAVMKLIFEKSIVTACPVVAGTVLTLEMLAFKKPGDGLGAARYRDVIGRKVVRDLSADHMLQMSDFA